MKRIFTLLALAAFALTTFAQSPDLMTYQAVLRDAENHLLTNQAIAIQISILQTTPNGTSVYTEIHTLNTNANGLVSLVIGDGVSGDDFSMIDWSAGPFFLKSETDPSGGTSYTITSTTQLLSVPYAKYADEAGNVFSGSYGDLIGAPTLVSAFANDEGYLTGITGSETAFDGWDKNVADDFSGIYGDLTGAPTNVSAFTNDAGYLTSGLWSQNGSNLYYNGGYIGIGTTAPVRPLTISTGAASNYSAWLNTATGPAVTDGFLVGINNTLEGFVWNWEAGPLLFGTHNVQRMVINSVGDVGIGTSNPTARLQVNGGTKIGSNGVTVNELREITGTTNATGMNVVIPYPSGYTVDNTRIISIEINLGGHGWASIGGHFRNTPVSGTSLFNVSIYMNTSQMYLYYPDDSDYHSRAYRMLIMRVE